jgi:hypothetical protein
MRYEGRVRDWQQWHRDYEDPSTSLSRRLTVVRRHVFDALSTPREAPIRVLSLCAGDGRDLLPVLADSTAPTEFTVLVEKDPVLAETARRTAADAQLEGVTVITGDAGDPAQFATAHPVDLLLLCGIFGNISEQDIRTTVAATPALLRDAGTVIWTRGSRDPDLRLSIRRWFEQAGLHETAFDSEPTGFGVGVGVKPPGVGAEASIPDKLFRFIR